jgi:hypothetical protein
VGRASLGRGHRFADHPTPPRFEGSNKTTCSFSALAAKGEGDVIV